jgi:hypothetical protein
MAEEMSTSAPSPLQVNLVLPTGFDMLTGATQTVPTGRSINFGKLKFSLNYVITVKKNHITATVPWPDNYPETAVRMAGESTEPIVSVVLFLVNRGLAMLKEFSNKPFLYSNLRYPRATKVTNDTFEKFATSGLERSALCMCLRLAVNHGYITATETMVYAIADGSFDPKLKVNALNFPVVNRLLTISPTDNTTSQVEKKGSNITVMLEYLEEKKYSKTLKTLLIESITNNGKTDIYNNLYNYFMDTLKAEELVVLYEFVGFKKENPQTGFTDYEIKMKASVETLLAVCHQREIQSQRK